MIVKFQNVLIKSIDNEQKITDKLTKKEFLIEVDGDTKYPFNLKIEAINQNIEKLKSSKVGDVTDVDVYLGSNEYKGKYYPSLRLASIGGYKNNNEQHKQKQEQEDDLPF